MTKTKEPGGPETSIAPAVGRPWLVFLLYQKGACFRDLASPDRGGKITGIQAKRRYGIRNWLADRPQASPAHRGRQAAAVSRDKPSELMI